MKELFTVLQKAMDTGEDTVLVTIIAGSGSTPRGVGARMLVGKNGRMCGTIGGGAVEYRALEMAGQCLKNKMSRIKGFTLRRNEVEDLGMICGGDVKVYFQFIPSDSSEMKALTEAALACFNKDRDIWIITDITDESVWQMGLYIDGQGIVGLPIQNEECPPLVKSGAVQAQIGSRLYYSEPLVHAGRVIIFGGGHISRELVPVLAHLGFFCVVFDDRETFACRELFPKADQIILGDFEHISRSIRIKKTDYVVVVTRGHSFDFIVQQQILQGEAAYIGVIGSRAKSLAVSQKLRESGISDEKINQIHTPIGIDIQAETPAEIAISIAAELIMVRARKMTIEPV